MAKRTALNARAKPVVPQTKEQTNDAIRKIGELSRALRRIQADINDRVASVKEEHEAKAQPIAALTEGMRTRCEAHRQEICAKDTKTARFPAGEVAWRVTPGKVTLKKIEDVIRRLKDAGLARFLRVKEEVDKEASLAEPDAVRAIPGIRIEKQEEIVIKPHEQELTAAAA
jgi:phage host-nuclease inhibitor protein Gam